MDIVERLRAPLDSGGCGWEFHDEAADLIESLRAQLAEAKKDAPDAKRYRWLRRDDCGPLTIYDGSRIFTGSYADAALDAEMATSSKKEG